MSDDNSIDLDDISRIHAKPASKPAAPETEPAANPPRVSYIHEETRFDTFSRDYGGEAFGNTFFRETVRNESLRIKKIGFRQHIVVILAVGAIGGTILGLGLGFRMFVSGGFVKDSAVTRVSVTSVTSEEYMIGSAETQIVPFVRVIGSFLRRADEADAKQLLNEEEKPFLGIVGEDIMIEQAGAQSTQKKGVYVRNVIQGAAAEQHGIMQTDIITGLNGEPIPDIDRLIELINGCDIGDMVYITILRDGKTVVTVEVVLSDSSSFEKIVIE